MRKKLIIPKRASEDISKLVSLTEVQLNELYNLLNSPYAVSEDFTDLLLMVSDKLEISNDFAIDLINITNSLTLQREKFDIQHEDFIEELRLVVEKEKAESVDEINKKKDLILKLTSTKPSTEHYKKLKFLKSGLIDTARGFRSICDVRPVFNEDRTEILDIMPIIIVEVEFEQKDSKRTNSAVFQLNEESFEKLKESIDTIQKKLDIMKSTIKIQKG